MKKSCIWTIVAVIALILHFSGCSDEVDTSVTQPTEAPTANNAIFAVEPLYDNAKEFSEGLAAVSFNGRWGFIDKGGVMVIEPAYDWAWTFSEGLCAVMVGKKYGYIDKSANIVIAPKFDDADTFRGGVAKIRIAEKYGVINRRGGIVLEPIYKHIFINEIPFPGGLILIAYDDDYGFADESGRFIPDPTLDSIRPLHNDIYVISRNHKKGLIDKGGRVIIEPKFDSIGSFPNDRYLVRLDYKQGLMDGDGNIIIEPNFYEFKEFYYGIAPVSDGLGWGLIDKNNRVILKPGYHDIAFTDLTENLVKIDADGRYGLAARDGASCIEPQFDYICQFPGRIAIFRDKQTWGYITTDWEVVRTQAEDLSLLFSDKLSRFVRNGKYGLINQSGKVILQPIYNSISGLECGLARIQLSHREKVFKDRENIVRMICSTYKRTGSWIESVKDIVRMIYSTYKRTGSWIESVKEIVTGHEYYTIIVNKVGLIDTNGNIMLKPECDSISEFSHNVAVVTEGKNQFLINTTGKAITEPTNSRIKTGTYIDGVAPFSIGKKKGLINDAGIVLAKPDYDRVDVSSGGSAKITKNRLTGLIDSQGKIEAEPKYDGFIRLTDDLTETVLNKKYGLLHRTRGLLYMPIFDRIDHIREGLAVVQLGGKYGYIDTNGNMIIKPQFDHAEDFHEGLARVRINGMNGFIKSPLGDEPVR